HCVLGLATGYNVSGLQPDEQYEFRVAAVNGVGRGNYSAPVGARTLNVTVPSQPGPPVVSAADSSMLKLQWAPSQEQGIAIEGYALQMRLPPGSRRPRPDGGTGLLLLTHNASTAVNTSQHNASQHVAGAAAAGAPVSEWRTVYYGPDSLARVD